MSTSTASPVSYADADLTDLTLVAESIAEVVAETASSLAMHEHLDGKRRLDQELWGQAVELGWLGIGLREEHGGLGLGPRGLDALFQGLGSVAAPGAFLPTLCAAQALSEVAGRSMLERLLPSIAAGECKIAVPAQLGVMDKAADLFLGDTDTELFLAPLGDRSYGLLQVGQGAVRPLDMWDRTRSLVRLDAAGADCMAMFDPGDQIEDRLTQHLALALASDCLGGSRALLAQTIAYMKDREQFGRPIGSFQALKHRVADMQTRIVSGEAVLEQALATFETADPDAPMWSALAKARLCDDFAFIGQDCLQLHGGVGFTWEFDVHVFLKRARLNEMLLAPGWNLRDRAAQQLAAAARAERSTLELSLI